MTNSLNISAADLRKIEALTSEQLADIRENIQESEYTDDETRAAMMQACADGHEVECFLPGVETTCPECSPEAATVKCTGCAAELPQEDVHYGHPAYGPVAHTYSGTVWLCQACYDKCTASSDKEAR